MNIGTKSHCPYTTFLPVKSTVDSGLDTEGVLGVQRTPKHNFGHPEGVQILQGVHLGVQGEFFNLRD